MKKKSQPHISITQGNVGFACIPLIASETNIIMAIRKKNPANKYIFCEVFITVGFVVYIQSIQYRIL